MDEADKTRTALMMILVATLIKKKKINRERQYWTRKWLLRRKALGCYDNLMKELALEDMEGYRRWIRMDTSSFQYLVERITPLIARRNTVMRSPISAGERLAITLRYLATGETQSSLAFQFRVAQNTISGIIPAVCAALYDILKDDFMAVPSSPVEWRKVSEKFYSLWNFPNCIGALDGKHVAITPPPNSGSNFFNYKKFFSIVLLALVDADLKFIYVDVVTNGRISDGGVWDKCSLRRVIESGNLGLPDMECLPGTNVRVPYVIVADDAFPLEPYMLKPYPGSCNGHQRIFNYRLSRARRVSENAFGILAARFQIFKSPILTSPARAIKIILATCCLHNFLRTQNCNLYTPLSSLDQEDIATCSFHRGTWRSATSSFVPLLRTLQRGSEVAKEVRSRMTAFVNNEGAVTWQEKMCNMH